MRRNVIASFSETDITCITAREELRTPDRGGSPSFAIGAVIDGYQSFYQRQLPRKGRGFLYRLSHLVVTTSQR